MAIVLMADFQLGTYSKWAIGTIENGATGPCVIRQNLL